MALCCFGQEQALRLVEAEVQAAEDGPPAGPDYAFGPGETVYCSFRVAGYKVEQAAGVKRVKLDYTIELADKAGILMAPAETGKVEEELNDEDRDWYPKRRAALQLPPYLAGGEATLTIHLTDQVEHASVSQSITLRLGGEGLEPSPSLAIQAFRFYRSEGDREAVPIAAYRPGNTVWAGFFITGFKTAEKNRHHVQYGLHVVAPDGRTVLAQEKAADEEAESFYPVPYIRGTLSLPTGADTATGSYTIVLEVKDLVGGQAFSGKYQFTVE